MATKVISGKVTGPDGTAKAGVVRAVLSQPCTIPGTQEVVASVVTTTAAADGTYSLTLQANNDLTPNGTYYTVTETTSDGGYYSATIIVPQTAGPFVLSSILSGVTPTASPAVGHLSSLTVDAAATFTAGPVTITGLSSVAASLAGVGAAGRTAALASTLTISSSFSDTMQAGDFTAIFASSDVSGSNKSVYAARMQAQNTGVGSATHLIGWKVNAPTNSGGGTVGVAFGGYIADMTTNFTNPGGNSTGLHLEGPNRLSGISWAGVRGAALDSRLYSTGVGLMSWESAALVITDATEQAAANSYQKFRVAGTVTAAAGLAISHYISSTLTASVNNDGLYGLYVGPTFNDNGKTGVTHDGIFVASGGVRIGTGGLTVSAGGAAITGTGGAAGTATLSDTGNAFVALKLTTNSVNKYLRLNGSTSTLEVVNSGNSAIIASLTDAGALTVAGGVGFYNHAVPTQPAAPVTLADVIAVIRGCGLSA